MASRRVYFILFQEPFKKKFVLFVCLLFSQEVISTNWIPKKNKKKLERIKRWDLHQTKISFANVSWPILAWDIVGKILYLAQLVSSEKFIYRKGWCIYFAQTTYSINPSKETIAYYVFTKKTVWTTLMTVCVDWISNKQFFCSSTFPVLSLSECKIRAKEEWLTTAT